MSARAEGIGLDGTIELTNETDELIPGSIANINPFHLELHKRRNGKEKYVSIARHNIYTKPEHSNDTLVCCHLTRV